MRGWTAPLVVVALAAVLMLVAGVSAQTTPPAAPTDLQALVVQDALLITLIWQDNAGDEESYLLERSVEGPDGPWSVIASLAADSSAHSDSGLEDGVTYWYRVAAENSAGMSGYSNVASGTATALPTPAFFIGDVNCDDNVNSIDAALVLQFDVGLVASLSCSRSADMNHDGVVNSLDAALILQYDVGLTDSLVRLSLNVKRPQGLCDDPEKPARCNVPTGTEFGLSISINGPPPEGYIAFQTHLFYGELRYNPTTFVDEEIVWPDSALAVRNRPGGAPPTGTEGVIFHGGMSGLVAPFRVSQYRGNIVEISITCSTQPQSFILALLPYGPMTNVMGSMLSLPGPGGGAGPTLPAKTVGQRDLDLDLSGTIEPDEEQLDVAAALEINCAALSGPVPRPAQ